MESMLKKEDSNWVGYYNIEEEKDNFVLSKFN